MTPTNQQHEAIPILAPPSPPAEERSRSQARQALQQAVSTSPAARIPTATYRVQFSDDFTFDDARHALRYLHRLGVGDLYGSPVFHAHSPHGYDILDHQRLNPALGGEAGFEALLADLHKRGMGYLMDLVPNHMGIEGNAWWNEVLENGPASPYAAYFDITWQPPDSSQPGRLLLPILEDQYGIVLEQGSLRLAAEAEQGAFVVTYHKHRYPLDPCSYGTVLRPVRDALTPPLPEDDPDVVELDSILTAIAHLPPRTATDLPALAERQREKEVIKQRLARLLARSPALGAALETTVTRFNGTPDTPASFDMLDQLLAEQVYRLAFWRVAGEEINYRRFFDVNSLAAIRVEEGEVFAAVHQVALEHLATRRITGLRVDHPDGLRDPTHYFATLQQAATRARARAILEADAGTLDERTLEALDEGVDEMSSALARQRPFYVVAEKIIEQGEQLPETWAIHGTTGYEFLNVLGGLFVNRAAERVLTRIYERFIGKRTTFEEILYAAKRHILQTALASELAMLTQALYALVKQNRRYRDFTRGAIGQALRAFITYLPVYRSYISETTERVSAADRAALEKALRLARRHTPELDASLFDFLGALLLLDLPAPTEEERSAQRQVILRIQQLSGPVMAKGLEDTAFYRYYRLASLNEVGGDPRCFGITPAEFHAHNDLVQQRWPHTLLATSTHDTKRSEDVRARIAVLSELPEAWQAAVGRWSRLNRGKRQQGEGERYPSRQDEYLLYQTLLGAWPLEPMDEAAHGAFAERIVAYMAKAASEAKVHTSWNHPNPAYDEALEQFVRSVLADERFRTAFDPLRRQVALLGAFNSLAQVTLKLAAPGVPDIYQGNECWRFDLVDPDNRRPVPLRRLEAALTELESLAASQPVPTLVQGLLDSWQDGRIKLWITRQALHHRRAHPDLYQAGRYIPLEADGPARDHLVAFARTDGEQTVVAIAPRLLHGLLVRQGVGEPSSLALGTAPWRGTTLPVPPGRYRHLLTDERFTLDGPAPLEEWLATSPVALLVREG